MSAAAASSLRVAAHAHALGVAAEHALWPRMLPPSAAGMQAHRCDVCQTLGTAWWRCTQGCDFDCCAECGQRTGATHEEALHAFEPGSLVRLSPAGAASAGGGAAALLPGELGFVVAVSGATYSVLAPGVDVPHCYAAAALQPAGALGAGAEMVLAPAALCVSAPRGPLRPGERAALVCADDGSAAPYSARAPGGGSRWYTRVLLRPALSAPPGTPLTASLARPGLRVVRGPAWRHGNQDGGAGGVGVIATSGADWVRVEWEAPGCGANNYSTRPSSLDLRLAPAFSVGSLVQLCADGASAGPLRPGDTGVVRGAAEADGELSYTVQLADGQSPHSYPLRALVAAHALRAGAHVARLGAGPPCVGVLLADEDADRSCASPFLVSWTGTAEPTRCARGDLVPVLRAPGAVVRLAAHEHPLGAAADAAAHWPDMRVVSPAGLSAHSCDLCRGEGTFWRCTQGCDFDACALCAADAAADAQAAESLAATPAAAAVTPAAASPGDVVTAQNLVAGMRVVRGPHWQWEEQDGGAGGVGTVGNFSTGADWDGWCCVRWDAGGRFNYRVRVDPPRHDLCVAPAGSSVGAGQPPPGAPVTLALARPGLRVVRGPDWCYMDQDGGAGCEGIITRTEQNGWCIVRWANGHSNSYRHGTHADLCVAPAEGSSAAAASVTPVAAAAETAFAPGDYVRLCTDYARYGDAASGPLSPGEVGVVAAADDSALPVQARHLSSGATWWYAARCLERAEPPCIRIAPEAAAAQLGEHGADDAAELTLWMLLRAAPPDAPRHQAHARGVLSAPLHASAGVTIRLRFLLQQVAASDATGVLSVGVAAAPSMLDAAALLGDGAGAADSTFGLQQLGCDEATAELSVCTGGFDIRASLPRATAGEVFSLVIRGAASGGATLALERGEQEVERCSLGGDGPFFACAKVPLGCVLVLTHASCNAADGASPHALQAAVSSESARARRRLHKNRREPVAAAAGGGGAGDWTFSVDDAGGALEPRPPLRDDFDVACGRLRAHLAAAAGDADSRQSVSVRRSPGASLLAQSAAALGSPGSRAWMSAMRVSFAGESGVDVGGLTREWFAAVSRALLDTDVVRRTAKQGAHEYYINPRARSAADLALCEFLGAFMGKALLEGSAPARAARHGVIALGGFRMCDVFFKVLLGDSIVLHDLKYIDPDEYRALANLQTMPIEGVIFETFTFQDHAPGGGPPVVTNLKPNGQRIAVTDANKAEYALLKAQHILYRSAEAQLEKVCDGFYSVVKREWVEAAGLSAAEFRAMLCGAEEIDVDALRQHTTYTGEYHGGHPVICWLWEVLREGTPAQRLAFLRFSTGADAMPAAGFALLGNPPFQVRAVSRGEDRAVRLPSSHTCFRQLDLPVYASKAELRDKLLAAIACEDYGLS